MVYNIADIPTFEKLILANASLLYRESYGSTILKAGASQDLKVIISATKDNKYVANVVDVASVKVLASATPDTNPAFAVLNLFNDSAAAVTKAFAEQVPTGVDPDASKEEQEKQLKADAKK